MIREGTLGDEIMDKGYDIPFEVMPEMLEEFGIESIQPRGLKTINGHKG